MAFSKNPTNINTQLNNLRPPKGARHRRKYIGRGSSSGHGGSSTRGTKGQLARSKVRLGFEGGQMPLYRRLPKRGFSHKKIQYQIVNVENLKKFAANTNITKELLYKVGLIKKKRAPVKLLGRGQLNIPLNIEVDKISSQARAKIEAVGGCVKCI